MAAVICRKISLILHHWKCVRDPLQSSKAMEASQFLWSINQFSSDRCVIFFQLLILESFEAYVEFPEESCFCLRQLQDSPRLQRKQRGLWTSRRNHDEDARVIFEQTLCGSKIKRCINVSLCFLQNIFDLNLNKRNKLELHQSASVKQRFACENDIVLSCTSQPLWLVFHSSFSYLKSFCIWNFFRSPLEKSNIWGKPKKA